MDNRHPLLTRVTCQAKLANQWPLRDRIFPTTTVDFWRTLRTLPGHVSTPRALPETGYSTVPFVPS